MQPTTRIALVCTLLAPLAAPATAQGSDFLFTTKYLEQTRSGSAGTALRFLNPNEVAALQFTTMPCTALSAEKWTPRTTFHTMAGDENGDTFYWNPAIFGEVDALVATFSGTPGGVPSQRTVFWSPSAAMGTAVSPAPLRPGDVGRIVRNGASDGQVQYFIRAEMIQMALGMPPSPVVVDVDAIAFSPNHGVFFSLDSDTAVSTVCGTTLVRDGDVVLIPPQALTYTPDMRIAGVTPGWAIVVHPEAQMNTFVTAAQVTDRNGVCVNQIIDLESLEIDWNSSSAGSVIPHCMGFACFVPPLLFTGETTTGAGVLTTAGGGAIATGPCGPLATSCGFGPTLGLQMGLRPPTAATGVASYVNALCATRYCRFVTVARNHVIASPGPAQIDVACPTGMAWVFFAFAPTGPGAVAPSTPFWLPNMCFPDIYCSVSMATIATPGGFGTYTSPVIPWPCKTIWQCATITASGTIEISTPTTVDVQ